MNEQFYFSLGAQLTALQTQNQQLAQALQQQAQQHQETRDLLESLAKRAGWDYSQDRKQWIPRRTEAVE